MKILGLPPPRAFFLRNTLEQNRREKERDNEMKSLRQALDQAVAREQVSDLLSYKQRSYR